MAIDTFIEMFLRLDGSLPHFPEQLSGILTRSDFDESIQRLRASDLVQVVEILDKALDKLSPASVTFRRTHNKLQRVCTFHRLLPLSHDLLRGALDISERPFTSRGFSDVYKGTYNGSRVCIKELRFSSDSDSEKAAKENTCALSGATILSLQIASEWMPGGDLTTYVNSNPSTNRVPLLVDVASGLEYLHSLCVIHGDLKGTNVLMDASGHARITDFGLAQHTFGEVLKAEGQSTRWTAPEVLAEKGTPSTEADIFSFAMVMAEVFTGKVPFDGDTSVETMMAITNGERPSRPTHEALTDRLWGLTQRCWAQDPHERPQMSEVLKVLNPSFSPTPPSATDRSVFPTPQPPLHQDFATPACKRLITDTSSQTEAAPLIEAILASQDEIEMIDRLCGHDAQAFIDAIDKALEERTNLPPRIRRECLGILCKTCGRHGLLPRSSKIPLCHDRSGTPLYHGGYADVWKGEHRGRPVAVKVLRVYSTTDFKKITGRFCEEVVPWKFLRHPNILPLLGVTMDNSLSLFAMTSEWMESGNINEFIEAHQDANRFELLKGVAKGLIYMHGQAMIHGDLKGANILIGRDGCACLADFGLLTIASDPTNSATLSSSAKGGTVRWMSPELLDPEQFGIKDGRPTRGSDSYAFGMVILEVLSGHSPFKQYRDVVVMRMVLEGKRPERPTAQEGARFTDGLWQMLTLCWGSQRQNRPSIEAILEFLEKGSSAWEPPSMQAGEDVEMGEDWDLTTAVDSSEPIPPDLQQPLTNPPEEDPLKRVTVVEDLPRAPGSYPAEGSNEIIVYNKNVSRFWNRGLIGGIRGLVNALGLGGGSSNTSTRSNTPAADRGIGVPDMGPRKTDNVKQDFRWWKWVRRMARAVGNLTRMFN